MDISSIKHLSIWNRYKGWYCYTDSEGEGKLFSRPY